MAQLVLAAAGAAIAGPLGFAWQTGWLVGSMLGSALFPQKTQGPRLDDRTIVGTEYGQAIPWVAGSPRLAGQYIWASPLREIANTQRAGKGGGAKVTTYTYECDVMIILSENVTAGVARDWLNAELVRNDLTVKDGIWNGVTVYTGEAGQLPDPIYEAAMGAGNAPAYRGRTTIVIRGLQLGGGKQLPNLEHQIVKVGQAIAEDDFKDYSGNNHPVTKPLPSSFLGCTSAVAKFGQAGRFNGLFANGLILGDAPVDATMGVPAMTLECWLYYDLDAYEARIFFNSADNTGVNPGQSIGSNFSLGTMRIVSQGPGGSNWSGIAAGEPGVSNTQFPKKQWFHFAITKQGNAWTMFFNGAVVCAWTSTGTITNSQLGVLGQVFTGSPSWPGYIDDFVISDTVRYIGNFTPPSAPHKPDEHTRLYIPFNRPQGLVPGTEPLNSVLEQLLARSGLTTSEYVVDPALAAIPVYGYATGQVASTRTDLETLRPFGLYEASCSDKLYIRPRARTPAGSVLWSDLGASESPDGFEEPFDLRTANERELPAQIAVRYKNASADGNVGTEFSDRLVSSMVSTQVADMAITMTPAQAKAVADTMLKDLMAGLGRATLKLGGRKYARYEPGDVLTTTDPDGRVWRFRILTKRDLLIMLEWDVVIDDATALDTPAITYEGYISTDAPARVASTEAEFLALPPLRDADASTPGAYVAVTPAKASASDEWPGCVVVRARLPEAFEQQFTTGDACVMGTCLTTLGDFPRGSGVLDNSQALRVRVRGELASSNWVDFHADRTVNAALVGDEPIRFMTANFVELDGQYRVYDLTGLLRGQLGQEHQIAGHVAGERFVLLSGAIRRMASETTDIGQEHQVKAVTLNTLLSSVTDEPFTDDGIALRPYSPVHLLALAQLSGDLSVSWVRRSRLVARYTDAGVFAPLGEAAEAYRIKVFDGATLVRTADVSTPAWAYAAADIAADGFAPGDPITITVQQLSVAVGEGFAATVETSAP
jgi:hypothetical protein